VQHASFVDDGQDAQRVLAQARFGKLTRVIRVNRAQVARHDFRTENLAAQTPMRRFFDVPKQRD